MLGEWPFILQWLLAVLAAAASIYLPGRLFLRGLGLRLDPLEHVTAACLSGAGLLVLVQIVFNLLHAPWLIWFYVLGTAIGVAAAGPLPPEKRSRPQAATLAADPLISYWPLGVMLLLGVLAQGRFMFFTGWPTHQTFSLLAWHGHDAPWHVFNLLRMSQDLPAEMPGFSGQTIMNYHVFSDLLWATVRRLAPIDPWHLYFRVAPIFYSLMLGLTTFLASLTWSGKKRVAYLATGLTLFGSNFGFLMPLCFGPQHSFIWDSTFWVQSALGNIFNPGVTSAYAFLWLGFWALVRWERERDWRFLPLLALFWGVLPGFKVYAGLLAFGALLVTALVMQWKQKDRALLTATWVTAPLFLLVMVPTAWHAPSLVRLLPGFNLATMLVAPDRMALMHAADLKLMFLHAPIGVALLMALLAVVFLVGNLGVRVLALPSLIKSVLQSERTDPMLFFMFSLLAAAWLAAITLVQTGVQWNTIQFFYFGVAIAALPAAEQFWDWVDGLQPKWRWALLGGMALLALPGAVQYLLVADFKSTCQREVMAGLDWIKQNSKPQDRVLRPLPDALMTDEGIAYWNYTQQRGKMTTLGHWMGDAQKVAANPAATAKPTDPAAGEQRLERMDTTLVAALTGRNTYLEDTVSAQILGYPVEARVMAVQRFFRTADVIEARELLEREGLDYVILLAGQTLPFDPSGVPLKRVFQNPAMTVYKYISQQGW